MIVWQTGTARLLNGRKSGPVFLTTRRGAISTTPSGYERLSYRGADPVRSSPRGLCPGSVR